MPDVELEQFWRRAMTAIKTRISQPTMWRAMEQLIPLTVEGDIFVMGVASGQGYHASQLQSTDRRNVVESVLSELMGRRMAFRLIEGDTLEDWEDTKKREESLRNSDAAKRAIRDRERLLEDSWDAVSDEVYALYGRVPLKQLPQNRAAFFWAALPILAKAQARLLVGENANVEANQRAYARLIDKVATLSDLPATWVAYELQRAGRTETPAG